ncbi:peptidase [Actinoplanes sp. NPDC051494]|uniref:peptidase n=1 Tax=Actinoplanes sp. NPDC051494 TaxID=3363907 RepID=UPI0037925AEE
MRKTLIAAIGATMIGVLPATPALAAPSPAPAPAVNIAGTSFLTAIAISPDQQVDVAAVTGDYLYWSFTAQAGQRPDLTATVELPPAADRNGAQAWTVEVFDGLRRRQACVAGEQSPQAAADDTDVTLRCQLRQVRSWAEPWDGDPLPGTYYVRLSSTELPDKDLGLPVTVGLLLAAPKGDTGADQGVLAAPLVPNNRPGSVLTGDVTSSAAPVDDDEGISWDWIPDFSSRWFWTAGGGVLAAIMGLIGFSWTRKRRVTA